MCIRDSGFTADDVAEALDALVAPPDPNVEAPPAPGSSIYGGFLRIPEPLLVVFAGAECPVCHQMLPQLFAIADRFPVALVITEELNEPELFESDATHLSVVLDPQWRLADLCRVNTVPTAFLWNTDGTLVWTHPGYVENVANIIDTFVDRQP